MTRAEIFPVTERELDAVCRLEEKSLSVPWTRQDFESAIQNEAIVFAHAVSDGETAGYIMMQLLGDEGEILNLAVDPDFRRRGAASALLEDCLSRADRAAASVYLEVRRSNEGARALYEKFGFAVIGERKRYYSHPAEDALVMCRAPKNDCV